MNEISKIQGRENLLQPQPQDVVPSKKGTSVNSVFIPYDTGVDGKGKHDGEITAGELNGIDKSLEQAMADLDDAAGKVKNGKEGRIINLLRNMANALINGNVNYDPTKSDTITKAMKDCDDRIADAKNIAYAAKQLKANLDKGTAVFERQTFNSEIALKELDDPEHNKRADQLKTLDKNKKILEKQIKNVVQQSVNESLTGEFKKEKIAALNALITQVQVDMKDVPKSNHLDGEYRTSDGQQQVFNDVRKFTITVTFIDGSTQEVKVEVPLPPEQVGKARPLGSTLNVTHDEQGEMEYE